MASKINKGLKRTALSVALGMCFAGSVYAQSNASGSIAGTTDSGASVTIENPATGFKREITANADGSYRVTALPTGTYKVTTKGVTRDVVVTIGTTATGSTANLETVNVVGSGVINTIDVASVESTTILTAQQIAKIPVARNITSVALLAPGTVKGDSFFGNLASFGGASVSENAYFVNGFNITNAFKNLNFAQIPFEAIAEQQVKTGGYGAEFGRALGGVVNIVTKRGTNDFHAGGAIFMSPEFLSETDPNQYNNSGVQQADNSRDNGRSEDVQLWASGALIKDRLFGYALLQYGINSSDSYPGTTTGKGVGGSNIHYHQKQPKYLVDLAWNINDNHSLEFTAISDDSKSDDSYFVTQFGTSSNPTWRPTRSSLKGVDYNKQASDSYILKYTGYLTDNFTLTALYGRGVFKRGEYAVAANGVVERYNGDLNSPVDGCAPISDQRDSTAAGVTSPIVSCAFAGSLTADGAKDTRDQFRVDADWVIGAHTLKFGIDTDRFQTKDGTATEGGYSWTYLTWARGDGTFLETVEGVHFQNGSEVKVNQRAFYVQDNWQMTDDFMAYVGLRWDTFDNKNGLGKSFVKINNQFSPRLGFSWDVNGDQRFKVYGTAGRYALPLTSNVAIRGGGSPSYYLLQDFTYTGIDAATGAPTGIQPIDPAVEPVVCDSGAFCTPFYINQEFGLEKTDSYASQNLKPMYQDEYILGFQSQVTDHVSVGVRGIYRDLKRAIDDTCAYTVFGEEEAAARGLTYDPYLNTGFSACHIFNPGSDLIIDTDVNNDGVLEHVTIAADRLAPKAKRTYKAVEFLAEGQWDRFFMQASYTWSQSKGNTEGGVQSTVGQADTGTTIDFDKLELSYGADGFLPNDRTHVIKVFGNYELNDEWAIGGNLLVQSGRPINCNGVYANDPAHYGNLYYSCGPNFDPTDTAIVPRGTAGRTGWVRELNLNVAYTPSWADGKLKLQMDVFNVFNEHTPTEVSDFAESSSGTSRLATTYKMPTAWQTPRSVRFQARYEFK